jgi:hypothetical protein
MWMCLQLTVVGGQEISLVQRETRDILNSLGIHEKVF